MSLATSDADGFAPSGQGRFARLYTLICLYLGQYAGRIALSGQLAALAALATAVLPSHKVQATPVAPAVIQSAPAALPQTVAEPIDVKLALETLLDRAGFRSTLDLRRLSLVQARKLNALNPVLPPVRAADEPPPFALSISTNNGKQALHCLTEAAYFEAGANGSDAEAAVVQVVLNRVRHPDFPKTVCGVVYQGAEHASASGGGCQFTFTCDGALNRPQDAAAWEEARKVASRALSGYVVKAVGVATYYHADYVFPAWAPALIKTATVGPHIFYRMPGQQGRAAYLTGQYDGGELKLRSTIQHALDAHAARKDEAEPTLGRPSGPRGRVHAQYVVASDAKLAAAGKVEAAAAPQTPVAEPVAQLEASPAA